MITKGKYIQVSNYTPKTFLVKCYAARILLASGLPRDIILRMALPVNKKSTAIILLLACLLFILYVYNLSYPPKPYYDEIQHVYFTQEIANNHNYTEYYNAHPPLWHLLVAACVKLFGDKPFVWRIISVICAMGVVFLIYRLAKKITGNPAVAALAVFLHVFDCISFTQARIAMMNSFMLLWMLWSILALLNAFPEQRPFDKKALVLCGIFFGLALATKLLAMNLFIFIGVIVFKEFLARKSERPALLIYSLIFLLLLPLFMHYAIHFSIVLFKGKTFADVWRIWHYHFDYLINLKESHLYASNFMGWPFILRPIWFHFEHILTNSPAAKVFGIICIGNPVIFWAIPLAVLCLCADFLKKRAYPSGLILLGFFSQWLFPFSLMKLTFFHYFYTAMPFACMAIALIIWKAWQKSMIWRWAAAIYLIAAAAMFIYWYPLLAGIGISQGIYQQHMWFERWI